MSLRRKVCYTLSGEPYIWFKRQRYYLKDFDKSGYHTFSFTNTGYFAGFRIINFDHGFDDFAIIEEV
jgi:hypothetical protein